VPRPCVSQLVRLSLSVFPAKVSRMVCVCVCVRSVVHLAFFGGERRTLPFWWREVFLLVERGAPCLFWWREVHLAFLVKRGAPCLFGGERFFFWRREVHLAFFGGERCTLPFW